MVEDPRTPPAPGSNSQTADEVNRNNDRAGVADTPDPDGGDDEDGKDD